MTPPNTTPDHNDREAILALLVDTIETTYERIQAFEAETPEDQELLIKWIRALGYLTGQYRMLLKDEDLDELEETVDLLKDATRRREGR